MRITLRPLQHSELNLLRELRNANADAFFDSREISRADQEYWWRVYQSDTSTSFFTIWTDAVTPIGFFSTRWLGRVDAEPGDRRFGVLEIGNLLLSPAYRGQGVMHRAIAEIRRYCGRDTLWIAHVKPTNTASLRVFERQGFWRAKPCRKSHS